MTEYVSYIYKQYTLDEAERWYIVVNRMPIAYSMVSTKKQGTREAKTMMANLLMENLLPIYERNRSMS